jgi:hypothetical protein
VCIGEWRAGCTSSLGIEGVPRFYRGLVGRACNLEIYHDAAYQTNSQNAADIAMTKQKDIVFEKVVNPEMVHSC